MKKEDSVKILENPCQPREFSRLGVYGAVMQDEKILLITQENGPYKGKFDFPGGGIEFGETAEGALRREFIEEVAMQFESLQLITNLTALVKVPDEGMNKGYTFYQIGMIYKVDGLSLDDKEKPTLIETWIDPKTLRKENCSALLWQFIINYYHDVNLVKVNDCNLAHLFERYMLLDLTHTLHEGIPSWSGSCGFRHEIKLDYADYAADVKFRVQQIKMGAGMGTHIDAPAHCIQDGITIDQLQLHDLIAPCALIDVSEFADEGYSVSVVDIENYEKKYGQIKAGQFVMIRTGWERYWHDAAKYRNNHIFPSVSACAAKFLLERHIVGLGIDTLSPDRPTDGFFVHESLLGQGKYIVENAANLKTLPAYGSYIFILPIKTAAGTEAPARIIALVPKDLSEK